jgi:hypothetical protein
MKLKRKDYNFYEYLNPKCVKLYGVKKELYMLDKISYIDNLKLEWNGEVVAINDDYIKLYIY